MKRIFIILLFMLLFLVAAVIWNFSYQESYEEATIYPDTQQEFGVIGQESGVFQRSRHALEYTKMPIEKKYERKLNQYYDNRAFYGAPPTVPHPIPEGGIGAKACLKCHLNGGFVNQYRAYAPVTPHPDKANCVQCHVAVKTSTKFVASSWKGYGGPDVGNAALPGSPPVIPHQLQMRENCLACHAGSSAVAEIRTTHPERVNCRQCHVAIEQKVSSIGNFKRLAD